MAKPHTTDGQYTNPSVRFERSDVKLSTVVAIGIVSTVIITVLSTATVWFGLFLNRVENKRKVTTLPPAKVDRDQLPPAPRLEAHEDLDRKKVALFPPRAQITLQPQEEMLKKGNKKERVLPIAEAINDLAGHLPAEEHPPPPGFGVPLPSKAASGRVETGGK
jgi:hypothetical protein